MKWTDVKFTDELFVQTDVSVSNSYSERDTLKLANMVLSIFDEYNLTDSYINDDVRIEYNDLLKLKDLAIDILKCEKGDEYE